MTTKHGKKRRKDKWFHFHAATLDGSSNHLLSTTVIHNLMDHDATSEDEQPQVDNIKRKEGNRRRKKNQISTLKKIFDLPRLWSWTRCELKAHVESRHTTKSNLFKGCLEAAGPRKVHRAVREVDKTKHVLHIDIAGPSHLFFPLTTVARTSWSVHSDCQAFRS